MRSSTFLKRFLTHLPTGGLKAPSGTAPKRSLFTEAPPPPAKSYAIVKPGNVMPQIACVDIPPRVPFPVYADRPGGDPLPGPFTSEPEIKSEETIQRMRKACALARRILIGAGELVRPGLTTEEIDQFVYDMCVASGAYPSPLNYRGFPKAVCTSVNNCACHGIPDDRKLKDGDIVNVDVTVFLDGVHGDCSETFLIGDVDERGRALVDAARESLYAGLAACRPGRPFREIGVACQDRAHELGYKVVPYFTGHGIGEYFHGPPDIYHYNTGIGAGYPGDMAPGMTFTVEPVVSEGSERIRILDDGWTAVSVDNSRSAQFEHTVLITEDGAELLTV